MRPTRWQLGLATAGLIGLGATAHAEEEPVHNVKSTVSSTTLSGYVSTSALWQFEGNDSTGRPIPGRSFVDRDKMNGFNLDAANVRLESPLGESLWSAGYNVDLLFGPDANRLGTVSTFQDTSDFAVKQAYVSLRAPVGNGLDFQAGVFDTVVGYENVHTVDNDHYSRSYGFFIQPFQHTGVLASYQFTDVVGAAFGVANTHDSRINNRAIEEEDVALLGALTLTAPEQTSGFLAGSQAYLGVVDGEITVFDAGGNRRGNNALNLYGGATVATPIEGVTLGIAYNWAKRNDPTLAAKQRAWTLAGYLSAEATQNLTLNLRGDYARSRDNMFGTLDRNLAPVPSEKLFALTGTVDYSLWANVITRAEIRWDHDLEDSDGGAFGTATSPTQNAFYGGLNVAYQF